MIIRIGMRCGYEGCWAQPLAIGSVFQNDGYSRRGAAPTRQRRLLDRCRSPASGRSFGAGSILVGPPLFAAGRRSYMGRWRYGNEKGDPKVAFF